MYYQHNPSATQVSSSIQPSCGLTETITPIVSLLPSGTVCRIMLTLYYCYYLFPVLAQQECSQLGLSVGVPVTFLLTAIISSLLTLLITQCLTMRGRSHSKFIPQQQQQQQQKQQQQQQKPVYDPVCAVSGTRPTGIVEMSSNVAYGNTVAATAASENITYETVQ